MSLFVTGARETIEMLADEIHKRLGYPKFGMRVDTGEYILPEPGQDPSTVFGVTLGYAEVMPSTKHDDVAAYVADGTTEPIIDELRNDATFAFVSAPTELPADW